MLIVEDRFVIKDLYRREVSISEIARLTGHDRKTIRAAIRAPLTGEKVKRAPRTCKIDPYVAYLEKRIEDGVLNAHKLFMEICKQGYPGGETQVKEFVHPSRVARQQQATVRFETEPGEQAQVDWGCFGYIDYQGQRRRLYGFVMTLGWSRASYLEFTVSADTAWWLRCHIHAFDYLGGVPQRVLHDNLKSAVLSRDVDGQIHWNPRYLDFASVMGFTPQACRPYRAQTKGKVESGVKYVKYNFWPGLHFVDLPDLNNQALTWINTIANPRIHGTTGVTPFSRLGQEALQSLPTRTYDTSVITSRRSSKDCLISYESNYYSVPAANAQQTLMVKETEAGDLLILTAQGEQIAQHRLIMGRRQRSIQPEHYAGLKPGQNQPRIPTAKQIIPALPTLPLPTSFPQVEVRPLSVYEALVGGI